MRHIFVDTSGWFELLVPGAPLQPRIADLARSPQLRFVTSTHVLHELVALIQLRGGHRAAFRAGSYLRTSREIRMECPDATEEAQVWRLFAARPDKRYSLTDCSSFVIMRRLGITEAVTLDDHFRQEGFKILP